MEDIACEDIISVGKCCIRTV